MAARVPSSRTGMASPPTRKRLIASTGWDAGAGGEQRGGARRGEELTETPGDARARRCARPWRLVALKIGGCQDSLEGPFSPRRESALAQAMATEHLGDFPLELGARAQLVAQGSPLRGRPLACGPQPPHAQATVPRRLATVPPPRPSNTARPPHSDHTLFVRGGPEQLILGARHRRTTTRPRGPPGREKPCMATAKIPDARTKRRGKDEGVEGWAT